MEHENIKQHPRIPAEDQSTNWLQYANLNGTGKDMISFETKKTHEVVYLEDKRKVYTDLCCKSFCLKKTQPFLPMNTLWSRNSELNSHFRMFLFPICVYAFFKSRIVITLRPTLLPKET